MRAVTYDVENKQSEAKDAYNIEASNRFALLKAIDSAVVKAAGNSVSYNTGTGKEWRIRTPPGKLSVRGSSPSSKITGIADERQSC